MDSCTSDVGSKGIRSAWHILAVAVASAIMAHPAIAANRTITGTSNNLTLGRTSQGAAETNVIRIGYPADYPDGYGDQIYSTTSSPARANPRTISNALSAQSSLVYNNRNLSDWVVQWGQFLTHDMDLTTNGASYNALFSGGTGNFSIAITDPNDPLGPNPMSFNRSKFNPSTGTSATIGGPGNGRPNWREQINSVTSYIDASNVYGPDATRAAALRTFADGKLITSANGLLPGLNTAGLANDDTFGAGSALFLAGDVRANEQVGLTATHALFTREHNRLATLLKANNPGFSDETIYQTARKIVGAEMQRITYKEFLPALLGSHAPNPDAYAYSSNVDASITNSFSTAFFRFGHSMQSPDIKLVDNSGLSLGSLSLRNAFFNPSILKNNPAEVDQVLKGLAIQTAQENDVLLIDDVRNFLFGPPGAGGLDLGALDIQRGRDHGLLDYNNFRPAYGLQKYTSISQLTSNTALRAALTSVYVNINNIDAFIGGIAEDHVSGTSVGSMLLASFVDQFTRLRDGDRFFYTGDADLKTSTVTSIIDLNSIRLSDIIELNTGVSTMQDNVFFATGTSLIGDANMDGKVDVRDLLALANGWNQSGSWSTGDFNGNGFVDGTDLDLLAKHWQTSSAASLSDALVELGLPATSVPEPVSLMGLACAGLLARRRTR